MKLLGMHVARRSVVYAVVDAVLALLSLIAAYAIRFDEPLFEVDVAELLRRQTGASSLFVATQLGLLYIAEAYDPGRDFRRPSQLVRIWGAVGFGALCLMALFYAIPQWHLGRGLLGIAGAIFLGAMTVWRLLMCQLRPRLDRRLRTVILGADHAGHQIANAIAHHSEQSDRYELLGFVDDPESIISPVEEPSSLPILGDRSALALWVLHERVECIIVAIRTGMSDELTRQLLD
jgi:FlaA1/EpsC-like NDP-sugar epimerase